MSHRNNGSRDPYWITARHGGTSANGEEFKAGAHVLYYPATRKIYTGEAAAIAWGMFRAAQFDEAQYNGSWA